MLNENNFANKETLWTYHSIKTKFDWINYEFKEALCKN